MAPASSFSLFSLLVLILSVFSPCPVVAPNPVVVPTPAPAPTNAPASSTSGSSSSSIPWSVPTGGLTFTQPAQTAAASYYKILQGVTITFGWNFTSIVSSPTSLTVQAVCTSNSVTYPVGPTNGIPGDATSVEWSPWDYNQSPGVTPLVQASYRLQIFDERGLGVGASPGLFHPNTGLNFALYIPAPYTPLGGGWTCGACNAGAALRAMHPALIALIATAVVMLVSGWSVLARVVPALALDDATAQERRTAVLDAAQ